MKLLTVAEVAAVLRSKKSFVYELISWGKLEAIRLSPRRTRVSETEVEKFLADKKEKTS